MEKPEYITKQGLNKLHKEIEHLQNVERRRISIQIAEARDKGDLSENAEYDAAKEAQAFLEIRISNLKKKLSNSRIIDTSKLDHTKVSILSKVKVKNIVNNAEQIYTLVPEGEANLKEGKISINTPIAIGLLGKNKGEFAKIYLPNNKIIELKILDIQSN